MILNIGKDGSINLPSLLFLELYMLIYRKTTKITKYPSNF